MCVERVRAIFQLDVLIARVRYACRFPVPALRIR